MNKKGLDDTYWDDLLILVWEKFLPLLLIVMGVGLYFAPENRNSERLDDLANLLVGGGLGAIRPTNKEKYQEKQDEDGKENNMYLQTDPSHYPYQPKDYEVTGQYSQESAILTKEASQSSNYNSYI